MLAVGLPHACVLCALRPAAHLALRAVCLFSTLLASPPSSQLYFNIKDGYLGACVLCWWQQQLVVNRHTPTTSVSMHHHNTSASNSAPTLAALQCISSNSSQLSSGELCASRWLPSDSLFHCLCVSVRGLSPPPPSANPCRSLAWHTRAQRPLFAVTRAGC